MIGASGNDYPAAKSWLLGVSYRALRSDEHYSGTARQYQRDTAGNNVVNKQQILDLSVTYAFGARCGGTLGVPLVAASWSIPLPVQPAPGERSEQDASGLGDISLMGRCWLGAPDPAKKGNLALGLGFKAPTGRDDVSDTYPDITGANTESKPVDISAQPGDGGWGLIFDMQTFRNVGPVTLFASGAYLANPRNTNTTPSILVGLGLGGNPAFSDRLLNTVPDQYVASVGVGMPLGVEGLSGSVAWRIEGVPRYDLIGDSEGFRRPGYETFFEPRVSWSRGDNGVSLAVPVGAVRNRQANPYTGDPGDATFPDYIVLLSYARSFGGAR